MLDIDDAVVGETTRDFARRRSCPAVEQVHGRFRSCPVNPCRLLGQLLQARRDLARRRSETRAVAATAVDLNPSLGQGELLERRRTAHGHGLEARTSQSSQDTTTYTDQME